MTPTEQDKGLREKIKTIIIGFDGGNWYDQKADSIMQLIAADRERVALEARLQEVEVSIIELERSDDPRFYSKDEAIRSQRARYTQLKAHQEEV